MCNYLPVVNSTEITKRFFSFLLEKFGSLEEASKHLSLSISELEALRSKNIYYFGITLISELQGLGIDFNWLFTGGNK